MSEQRKTPPSTTPPWRAVNPPEWAKPVGYANGVVSRGGTRVSVAGQIAMGPDGKVRHAGDLVLQATLAFENLVTVLRHAGAAPEHLVRVRIFVVSVEAYKQHARAIGQAWRATLGRWFPAMTLVQVVRLYDDHALIEVEGEAVVP
jgi:enamine deaminase RidA (YjgF/YER057c/UK114 family)